MASISWMASRLRHSDPLEMLHPMKNFLSYDVQDEIQLSTCYCPSTGVLYIPVKISTVQPASTSGASTPSTSEGSTRSTSGPVQSTLLNHLLEMVDPSLGDGTTVSRRWLGTVHHYPAPQRLQHPAPRLKGEFQEKNNHGPYFPNTLPLE